MNDQDELQKWVGKATLSDEVKILSYTPSSEFDLETEKIKTIVHRFNSNKETEQIEVDCLKVNRIVVKTPKLTILDAENYVREKAQTIADYLGFLQNKFIQADISELCPIGKIEKHGYNENFDATEVTTSQYPQIADLTIIDKMDENTLSQLSNYNLATQHNNFLRFIGSFKVIELQNPNDKTLLEHKTLRHVLSHGSVESKEAMEAAKKTFERLSFRPTHITDRKKIFTQAYQLKETAREYLKEKIDIKWITNQDLFLINEKNCKNRLEEQTKEKSESKENKNNFIVKILILFIGIFTFSIGFLTTQEIALPVGMAGIGIIIFSILLLLKIIKIEKLNILDIISIIILINGAIYFLSGNGLYGLVLLSAIAFIHVFRAFWQISKSGFTEIEKPSYVLAGSGAILFALITFIISQPIFLVSGSENACLAQLEANDKNFVVTIGTIKVEYFGEKLGLIEAVSYTKTSEKIMECKNCDLHYPKPDRDQNGRQLTTQNINPIITIERKDSNIEYLKIFQQTRQRTYLIPYLSQITSPLQLCDCEAKLDNNSITCKNGILDYIPYLLSNTWFFNSGFIK